MKTCISDSVLADHIKSTIHQNTQLSDEAIHVSVDEGWVSLEGKVDKEEDRRLVEQCVENILGVYEVTNNLTFSRIHRN